MLVVLLLLKIRERGLGSIFHPKGTNSMFKAEKRAQVRGAPKIGRDALGQRAFYSLEVWDSFETGEHHGPQKYVHTHKVCIILQTYRPTKAYPWIPKY